MISGNSSFWKILEKQKQMTRGASNASGILPIARQTVVKEVDCKVSSIKVISKNIVRTTEAE